MDNVLGIILSWQVLVLGISVALLMAFFVFLGSKLWAVKKLRKLIKFCNSATVWLPSLFGAGLGAIPVWPRPGPIQDMPEWQGYFSMILMGLICGTFYERIWKFVKERVASAGIDIDLDLPPNEQLRKKTK